METYLVTLETPRGEYQIEVPTHLGPEAAGRRAAFTVASAFERSTDLDAIRVVGTTVLP